MKRILSLVLALMMVFTLAVSFAEGNGSEGGSEGGSSESTTTPVTITIGEYDESYYTKGADEINYATHTFKAAQILAATAYDDDTKEYSGLTWGAQVTSNPSELLTALKADATWGTTFANYVTAAADVDNTHPQFTAASFAKAISGANDSKAKALAQVLKALYAGQGTEIKGTSAVELPGIGYYLIDDVTTSLENDAANPVVLFAGPGDTKVRIKADKPSQDKQVKENEAAKATWNEVADYNIGDAVPFKITSKVPNADAYTTYTMKFTDTMSAGLTLFDNWPNTSVAPSNVTTAENIKVEIGGEDVTDETGVTITKTGLQDATFTVELKIKESGTQKTWASAGDAIVISYYGVLNQSAVVGLDGNTNKSKLEYSNNPDDDTSKTETPEDTVIVFTYELDVNKIDGATEAVLPGAQFALKATDGEHSGKYVVVNGDGKVVDWQTTAPEADAAAVDGKTALLTSGSDGKFNVIGLDDGEYSLEEIKAPSGYNTISAIAIKIIAGTVHTADGETASAALTELKIDVAGTETEGTISTGIVETTVENNSGATLPSTGGIGTTIFYVLGSVMALGALVLLVTKRRVNVQ